MVREASIRSGFSRGRSASTAQAMTPTAKRAAVKVQGYRIIASSLVWYQSPDQVEQRLVLRTVYAVAQESADFNVRGPSS